MTTFRTLLIWSVLCASVAASIIATATSPYLQYRSSIYIIAGFSGVIALAVLLFQPLLAGGLLPGISLAFGRRLHLWTGAALMLSVGVHIAGLWITSPPDMVDALTFTAPTAFSAYGVVAMWAMVATAVLAVFRRRLRFRPLVWRLAHVTLATTVVAGSVIHALLIEGTMETITKTLTCFMVVCALAMTVHRLRPWKGFQRHRPSRTRE